MNIEQLNTDYGIADQLRIIQGEGGLPFIEINNGKANTLISIYSAQVLSFQPIKESEDLMFLSKKAYYQSGKAIKGGVPICWPWFGSDPEGLGRPSHGFVRNRLWTLVDTSTMENGDSKVTLSLNDTPETREIWQHAFELTLIIYVGDALTLELITHNRGKQAFPITQAFHTYFKVGDIQKVSVLGLENTAYLDNVDQGNQKTQIGSVTIAGEVDRIYTDVAESELVIDDPALNRQISITSINSKTAVVWSPWAKIAANMADLEDDDYNHFICVETVNAANEVIEVLPGNSCRLVTTYRVKQS